MLNLKKEVKDINRFKQIVMILSEEGFGYLFHKLNLKDLFKRKEPKDEEKPKRLRKTLEKLGPTFIKLGQILSLRPDLLPKEYIRELGNLQDRVPPFPCKKVEEIIKQELKKPISRLFIDFSKSPIAAASISQVHKAKLKNGKVVAVKVQRPNVKEIMETDIDIMFYIARLLENHSEKIRKYHPVKIVEEFRDWTEKELNFEIEANNAKAFYINFKNSASVKIPKVYEDYSTKKVLTTEFIDGIELHKIDQLKGKKGYNIKTILKNGFDAILTQVFVHGFFHADPHPSNILILKGNRIAFVDFGIVGTFDDELKQKSVELLYGIIEEDIDSIVDAFLDMGLVDESETDLAQFKADVRKVVDPLQKSTLEKVKISYVLEEVLDIAFKHHVKMPLDFILFGKAIVELEGIGLEYEPDFKFVENARPFIEKLIKKEIRPMNMARGLAKNLAKYRKLFREFPDQVNSVFRKIQKGSIKVDIEDTDIKKLGRDLDVSTNRLTYGIMVAAFIIAGALLSNMKKPSLYGIPLFSLVFFIVAVLFLIPLIISIQKEKKNLR